MNVDEALTHLSGLRDAMKAEPYPDDDYFDYEDSVTSAYDIGRGDGYNDGARAAYGMAIILLGGTFND